MPGLSQHMTTIAANRVMMAADSLVTAATKTSARKIWLIRGWIVGGAGGYSDILDIISEMRLNKDLTPKQLLENVKLNAEDAELLLLSPSGKIYHSEGAATPIEILEPYAAVGAGAQGAVVAMRLGLSPIEAVREMRHVDPNTGGRVRHYTI